MNPTTAIPATDATEQTGLHLAQELRRRWASGEQPPAELLLAEHPELSQRADVVVDLIYEEFCLRESAGQQGMEQDIFRRFPQWIGPLRVMLDCHRRLIQSKLDEPRMPGVGDRVGEFRLTAELARGSRGRVFQAAQTALADRPVVLKITPLDGAEHVSLARLQHTNIVPLYSVLDDPARAIRVLCMPYFGRATLASVLQILIEVPLANRTGRHIVEAIDRMQDAASSPPTVASAARQMLASVSYEQAMCWIAACLADALQFAHERGLVHLDLKPSNILLGADGQPMLLDFHLAREAIVPDGSLPESFGGTPPYMPPEQHDAMQSLRDGKPVQVAVDARADIYALGAILYEALGGRLPIACDSSPLQSVNPRVSPGLSDILDKCLASRGAERYADAQALADDLRRHLTDQPLGSVSNRSLGERWQKWRRRRPGALRAVAMLLLVCGALLALLAGAWLHLHDRHEQTELTLYNAHRQMRSGEDATQAVDTLQRGLDLLAHVPFEHDLRQQLSDELAVARRLVLAQQLHELADEMRVLYGSMESIAPLRLRALASQCDSFWRKRDAILHALAGAKESQVLSDLQDIAIFAASLNAESPVDPGAASEGHREALRILDEAAATFGPGAVLEHERQRHRKALGLAGVSASPQAPRTAWEHYVIGRSLLAAGDYAPASQELTAALELDPAARWANFHYGLCAYRLGRYPDAVAAFSVCIGVSPNVAGYFYNRAMAYNSWERRELALSDYNRTLQIDPTHAAALLNRGVMHYQQGHFPQACADLHRALKHGADPAAAHYDLALVYQADNDFVVALQHAQRALEHDRGHQRAVELRDLLQRQAPAR